MFFRRKFWTVIFPRSHIQPAQVKKWSKQIQMYAWPFMTWGMFLWVQQSSDRWALQAFSQTKDVGYYAVLSQLGYMPIIIFTGIIVQFLQPILFAKVGNGTDPIRVKRARQINLLVIASFVAMTVLGSVVAFVFHTQIFALLVAPEYRNISLFMPWMVLSGGLFASSEMTALLLMSGMNTKILIAPKIGTAIAGIVMNVAGAYWLGLQGVILASVGFSLVLLAWMLVLSNRPQRVEMISKENEL
jgi:O-antigen/teichoic acid export membrane protein